MLRTAMRATVPLSLIRQVQVAAAPGAINLAVGEPSHAVPAPVRAAIDDAVRRGDFGYSLNAGRRDLRRAVAARRPFHGRDERSTLITVGSQEALALAVLGLTDAGDEIVIPEIAYPAYETLPRLAGATPVRAPLDAIEAAITPRTRMILVGSPSNPTGEVVGGERFHELADLAAARDLWLLSDEVYEELWLDVPPRYASGPRVLHVGGISKSLALTGLRLGWLVAPPEISEALLGFHQNLVTCAPSLAQTAALAGFALPIADLDAIREEYRRRWTLMRALLAAIPGVRWLEPAGAFYVFVDLRERLASTTELAFELARAGEVLVVPGEGFGPAGQGWLRLSFSVPEADIREGVGRLEAALG